MPRAGVSVEEIMRSIEERTGCFFAFDRRAFDVTRTVQAPPAEAGVEELLTLITDGTDFEWLRNGVYIVIHYSPRRVAPPVVSAPRTSDVYSPSDPNADAFGTRPVMGSNFSIYVTAETHDEAYHIFNSLSQGGKVQMPMSRAHWGDYFGMCTDKFGISWFVNFSPKL